MFRLLPVVMMTLLVVKMDLARCEDSPVMSRKQLSEGLRNLTTKVKSLEDRLSGRCDNHIEELGEKLSEGIARMGQALGESIARLGETLVPKEGVCKPDHNTDQRKPSSCFAVKEYDKSNSVHTLTVNNRDVTVFCDQNTTGGGWTVIQRRLDGQINFERYWTDYENGFGDLTHEFWLGLKNIRQLTSSQPYSLRVDLEDFDGSKAYAEYRDFSISGPEDSYRLSIGGYNGTAGDSINGCSPENHSQNNQQFSTPDRDNDGSSSKNCALDALHGGWWYNSCTCANPNGRYSATGVASGEWDGLRWDTWSEGDHTKSYKHVEMKIRPRP